jgi:proline iminopeptidase
VSLLRPRFFPEEWEWFRAGIPEPERNGDLLAAYARLMESPDADVRGKAAGVGRRGHLAGTARDAQRVQLPAAGRPARDRPICAHYFSHAAWLEEGALLRDAHRLAGIPGVLIHGRLDMGSPLGTAWELARGWPDARLMVIDDSGHTGSETMKSQILDALERFARC